MLGDTAGTAEGTLWPGDLGDKGSTEDGMSRFLPKTEAHTEINLWEKLLEHHYLVVLKAINQESTKECNSSAAQILLSLTAFHKNLYSSFL